MEIKDNIKKIIIQLPGIKKIVQQNLLLKDELEDRRHSSAYIGQQLVDYRLQLKKINKEKINVVFVCHRPAVWESLHSVYDALKADNDFEVYIVAIPNKKELPKLGLNHEIYESEGAEEFWEEYGCIRGYDYQTKEWFDLKQLCPDYVFFQQPYNDTRCDAYKSWNVATYAKLCYVPYAYDFIGNGVLEETTPKDFMSDVSFYFTQNQIDDSMIRNILSTYSISNIKTVISGFPRYDFLDQYIHKNSDSWEFSGENKFRIMWTPRWCTNEGNCNFFDYKDNLVDYAKENEDIAFLFRPHPQAFLNWNRTGEFPKEEVDKYKNIYENSKNMKIDTKRTYFDTIFDSDCLISDTSSFIADYFMTGKPIIYCHKIDMFNKLSKRMSEGFYWVHNWNELKDVMDNLRQGKDVLKDKRLKILSELTNEKSTAAEKIVQTLKKDACL